MFRSGLRLVLVAIAAAALAPSGASVRAGGTIPPLPPLTRIAVIGDFGLSGAPEQQVADLVKSWQPDYVITTGDNNYPAGAASTIDANIGQYYAWAIHPYAGAYGPGAASNLFFPVLGNHDWNTAAGAPPLPQPYLDYFSLPAGPGDERYYEAVLGSVHLFALDSDPREPDEILSTSVQADWLRSRLGAAAEPWKLVTLHHPPFSSSTVHGSTAALQWPFAAWGATAVLAGHDHAYERLAHDGIPYIVNGAGGASLYAFGAPVAGSQVRYDARHGAMLIEATPLTMTLRFIDDTGAVQDVYTVSAPTPPPASAAAATVEVRVGQGEDDAEEKVATGQVVTASTDLELTEDTGVAQLVGIRFAGVDVPPGAAVARAYLEFTTDETGSDATNLEVMGELSAAPAPFTTTAGSISARPRTAASVAWNNVVGWPAVGWNHRTPDLALVVQELIDQPGRQAGGALVFLISGSGRRTAEAFEGDAAHAALLHVEYTLPARSFLPAVIVP